MMNDEQFEGTMTALEINGYSRQVAQLRARDTAQRDSLAQVEAELSDIRHKAFTAAMARDTAQAQLAEAVGLLRDTYHQPFIKSELLKKIEPFLARYAQAEQQEAQSAQAEPANFGQELEAFEKWRHTQADSLRRCGYPDGADAFIRLGSVQWAGWQARAALATQPAVHGALPEPKGPAEYRGSSSLYAKGWNDCLSAVRGAEQ